MIKRVFKNLGVYDGEAPAASARLEQEGWALLPSVFAPVLVEEMKSEIEEVFGAFPPERFREDKQEYRYEMFNRSAACQRAIGDPRILEVVEPLLGEDCHVIANTAWKNPPEFEGGPWHCDAGPHIPRPVGVEWDDRIPYPVFAIAAHLMLADCALADGPTAVVPGSHRSGRLAPFDQMWDPDLTYDGRPPRVFEVEAGDVVLFVSDAWHRGLPAREGQGRGRFFMQAHYARRDIAQRVRDIDSANQCSPEAIARADSPRARTLIGLHEPFFYDA
jgi:ectoine hydroxylase-related dioxygenase (phytanoyl-CoA dioxygenase family)